MVKLVELLSYNHTVFVFGQEKSFYESETNENIHICKEIEECLNDCDVIASGIPLSIDNVTINSPYSNEIIKLDKIYLNAKNKIFIAGGIPIQFYENKTIRNIDLLQKDELTILNAIPTVEGTIKIAIEHTPNTVHESNILVFGFGKVGKILCKDLKNLGANVYCVARKEADLAWIREERYMPIQYNEVEKYAKDMDILINTVPSKVVDEKTIKRLKKTCVIIDVASIPGGVDKNIAKMYKIKVITAFGIPGKTAPLTAAKYIKEIIEKEL